MELAKCANAFQSSPIVTCPVGGMLKKALVSDKKRILLMSVGKLGKDLSAFFRSRDRYRGKKRESVSARQFGERRDCGHQYGWFLVEEARRQEQSLPAYMSAALGRSKMWRCICVCCILCGLVDENVCSECGRRMHWLTEEVGGAWNTRQAQTASVHVREKAESSIAAYVGLPV